MGKSCFSKVSNSITDKIAGIDSVSHLQIDSNESSSTTSDSIQYFVECSNVGEIVGDGCGVIRLRKTDTLKIYLPPGTIFSKSGVILSSENCHSQKTKTTGEPTCLFGGMLFLWRPTIAGAYEFHLELEGLNGPSSNIIVEPDITINGKSLNPSELIMQTVLTRCLRNAETWEGKFVQTSLLGYNSIHFTPLQPPGISGSCYSLGDQLGFDSRLFPSSFENKIVDKDAAFSSVPIKDAEPFFSRIIGDLESRHGFFCTTDLVLNHTAHSSPWLRDCPSAGYSLMNSPHLIKAFELDRRFQNFGKLIIEGKIDGLNSDLKNGDDLAKMKSAAKQFVTQPMNIPSLFTISPKWTNIENIKKEILPHLLKFPVFEGPNLTIKDDTWLDDVLYFNFSSTVGSQDNSSFSSENLHLLQSFSIRNPEFMDAQRVQASIFRVQTRLLAEASNVEDSILNALEGSVRHERLVEKKGPITLNPGNTLTTCYFTIVVPRHRDEYKCIKSAIEKIGVNGFSSLNHSEQEIVKKYTVANNGWVMGWDARHDFAAPSASHIYLRRGLVAWGDCVKLRYGNDRLTCPPLWDRMESYCRCMARLFKGVRLDNCHSTPLHVAKKLLAAAREERPDLWVYAELFTGSEDIDYLFESHLGLSALIREASHAHSADTLSDASVQYAGRPIGGLLHDDSEMLLARADIGADELLKGSILARRSRITPLLFDCTHDNLTPSEASTPEQAVSLALSTAASCAAIGSTRGFDELRHKLLSVVAEERAYQIFDEHERLVICRVRNTIDQSLEAFNQSTRMNSTIIATDSFSQKKKSSNIVENTKYNGDRDEVIAQAKSEPEPAFNQQPHLPTRPHIDVQPVHKVNIIVNAKRTSATAANLLSPSPFQASFPVFGDSSDSPANLNNSPLEQYLELSWRQGHPSEVEVYGDWDGWHSPIQMNVVDVPSLPASEGHPRIFQAKVPVSVLDTDRPFEFKFVVDKKWRTNTDFPEIVHNNGDVNNIWSLGEQNADVPLLSPLPVSALKGWARHHKLGIAPLKVALNRIHSFVSKNAFSQVRSFSAGNDVVVTQRRRPSDGASIFFITRAAPSGISATRDRVRLILPLGDNSYYQDDKLHDHAARHVSRGFVTAKILLAGAVKVDKPSTLDFSHLIEEDDENINGLTCHMSLAVDGSAPSDFGLSLVTADGGSDNSYGPGRACCLLHIRRLPRGSAVVVACMPAALPADSFRECQEKLEKEIVPLVSNVNMQELSYLLYSCENEELDRTAGTRGCYDIPGLGKLPFAGIASVAHELKVHRRQRDGWNNGFLFENISSGDWLLEYFVKRTTNNENLSTSKKNFVCSESLRKVGDWLQRAGSLWKKWLIARAEVSSTKASAAHKLVELSTSNDCNLCPVQTVSVVALSSKLKEKKMDIWTPLDRGIPLVYAGRSGVLSQNDSIEKICHSESVWQARRTYAFECFEWAIMTLFSAVESTIISRMPTDIKEASGKDSMIRHLAMASLQFYSFAPSSPLIVNSQLPSIAAGLPHFSSGFMRAWGRDTFIALPGVLLSTGRFEEAKQEILGFARVARHALIPNLLDSGSNPRFNARDATWFFLQAIQDFVNEAPNGEEIFKEKVDFKHNQRDICAGELEGRLQTLGDLIVGILKAHANNRVDFREWNAGSQIDEQMKFEGFDVRITLCEETGFLLGGSTFNCGTWMDKMGSSAKAGNKGVPATPRDGMPIELAGLLRSTLGFVDKYSKKGILSPECDDGCVLTGKGQKWTYRDWASKIDASFLVSFFVPEETADDALFGVAAHEIRGSRVYLRDCFHSWDNWRTYQMRCNAPIAIAVNESLSIIPPFVALDVCKRLVTCLTSPNSLGMKTLSPSDPLFCAVYNNADDSDNFQTANGFSYHNGPEWVWPLGYALDAILLATKKNSNDWTRDAHSKLKGNKEVLQAVQSSFKRETPWKDSSGKKRALMDVAHFSFSTLLPHRQYIEWDSWGSLPELTNENGSPCYFSCNSQAWSVATLLRHIQKLQKELKSL